MIDGGKAATAVLAIGLAGGASAAQWSAEPRFRSAPTSTPIAGSSIPRRRRAARRLGGSVDLARVTETVPPERAPAVRCCAAIDERTKRSTPTTGAWICISSARANARQFGVERAGGRRQHAHDGARRHRHRRRTTRGAAPCQRARTASLTLGERSKLQYSVESSSTSTSTTPLAPDSLPYRYPAAYAGLEFDATDRSQLRDHRERRPSRRAVDARSHGQLHGARELERERDRTLQPRGQWRREPYRVRLRFGSTVRCLACRASWHGAASTFTFALSRDVEPSALGAWSKADSFSATWRWLLS